MSRAGARSFDLVVGADGLHSNVRKLAFGPQQQFEKDLGYVVAAFEARGYRPRDEDVYVIYSEPGRMVGRVALRDDRTLILFVFARNDATLAADARPTGAEGDAAPEVRAPTVGNAGRFSSASIARRTSISIGSPRSKCLPGRAAASRWSATRLSASR